MARMGVGELRSVFGHFLRTFGFRAAKNYSDVGGYQIDHYNGYTIEQIISAGGGVTQPFGGTRYTARELINMLHFAMSVHDHQENEKRGRGRNPPERSSGLFSDSQDIEWVRETHLRGTPAEDEEFSSFEIIGNEDSPDEIRLYSRIAPLTGDGYYSVIFRDGEFSHGEWVRGRNAKN